MGRMDVTTPKDTATFWSGGLPIAGGGFDSSRGFAEALAKSNGRLTLESTPGGRVLDGLKIGDKASPLVEDVETVKL